MKRQFLKQSKYSVIIFFFIFCSIILFSAFQSKENAETRENYLFTGKSENIIQRILNTKSEQNSKSSFGNLVAKVGLQFLGTPYLGNTLEGEPEICRIDVEGLDCVTFFETSLNLARMIENGEKNPLKLPEYLIQTRYRNGVITDYSSRLHYTSDWIRQNTSNFIVDDMTEQLGGVKTRFELSFMSKNPKYYKALQLHPELIEVIKNQEKEINKIDYFIIPTNDVKSIEKQLKSGDIIAIAMNRKDLDYSHTGMIYVNEKNEARFLHASSSKNKVVIDTTISEYLKANPKNTGITVLRPLSLRKKLFNN